MHHLKKPAIVLLAFFASFFFVFASAKKPHDKPVAVAAPASHNVVENNVALFSELHLGEAGMAPAVFNSAIRGFEKLTEAGVVKRNGLLTVIDFSKPSNQKRLYVLDLRNKQILFNTLVSHGRNSGTLWASSFSNDATSLKSSPGFYLTGETFMGDNGYSLRLDGLEKNINDNARNRSIVMHGAPYVSQSAINSLGFLGRSWGCPAIPLASRTAIINTIKDGTCLFIYTPQNSYLQSSSLLNS